MRLIIVTLAALCLSIGVQANPITAHLDNPNVVVEELDGRKIQLRLLEIPEGRVLVTFKNQTRGIIFKDVIESGKFTKKNYDLNHLANGDYSVEIFSKEHGVLENVDISLGAETSANEYFAKTKVVDGNNIAFLVKTTDEVEKTVRIYHNGQVVHEEAFTGDTFGKVFKFKQVRSLKDISFEISNNSGIGKYVSAK